MKNILPNGRAYDRVGDHSLFSPEHCCICGKPTANTAEFILLTRAVDGACEYAISHPSEANAEEIRAGLWLAPIGPDCLKKHPQVRHAVLGELEAENRRLRETLAGLTGEVEAIAAGEFGRDWADGFGPLFGLVESAKAALADKGGTE